MAFATRCTGVSIKRDDDLFWKAGMAGLDVISFFEEFAEQFNIDMTKWTGNEYIDESPSLKDVVMLPKRVVHMLLGRKKDRQKPVTIRHLVAVAETGVWFDPE